MTHERCIHCGRQIVPAPRGLGYVHRRTERSACTTVATPPPAQ